MAKTPPGDRWTQVRPLVWEDATCHGATKLAQPLSPSALEPVLHNRRSHNVTPTHRNKRVNPRSPQPETACAAIKTQHGQKYKVNTEIRLLLLKKEVLFVKQFN